MMRQALLLLFIAACPSSLPPPPIHVDPTPIASAPLPVIAPKPVEPTDGPAPPTVQPIDPKTKVDGAGLFNAVTSKEVWLWFGEYTVVVDRATGCATEQYPDWGHNLLQKGISVDDWEKPELLEQIRNVVGLGRRFGVQRTPYNDHIAWSPDGRYVYVEANAGLYRSTNGARTFSRLPDNGGASRLTMNGAGTHLVYERGNEFVTLANDATQPLKLTSGQTFPMFARGENDFYFFRTSKTEECLDIFDTRANQLTKAHCVPLPKHVKGNWLGQEWESVSPNGRWGIVKWEIGDPGLTYIVSLVDLSSDKIVTTIRDMRGDVDDDGNMVMQSQSEGGGDHTYFYPLNGQRKLIGNHFLLDYRDHAAILGVHRTASLGSRKCDLVKIITVP